ncbi:MAG: sulfite dehydrogenase [Burkholderiales bacterium]|nr:sulfite dehydrogenase [Burkholderiales bacterium]
MSGDPTPVAGNGLLSRRAFLRGGVAVGAGALATAVHAADAAPRAVQPWQQVPGAALAPTGAPSPFEPALERKVASLFGASTPGNGVAWTPLERLHGTITPSAVHFERHHHGVPDIDPARHRLLIHGLVRHALRFDVEHLLRYPMVHRQVFIECSGNSFPNAGATAPDLTCGQIHGLVSCSEWSGVPLALLLDEAGIKPSAKWIVAEGADAATMARSIPLSKALDDAIVALWQNGERLRPSQGYPVRLVLPGWEGNMQIKWLQRIAVTDGPQHTRDETSHYTDLLADGRALQFTFVMGVKSVITHPSPGWLLTAPGYHDVSGLAWSGSGRIARVEVTADGGATWADAELQGTAAPFGFVRFRLPWRWDGGPAVLASRATDTDGRVQPTRADWIARYAPNQRYHLNAVQAWRVDEFGELRNVFL